ncbi:TPA: MBL fold metallo-hydrolase [Serratia liquefaciens]|nr:MBL fold metallo-hydrolase [Serratia liquefaciens]HED2339280.1 MBL fold metallo-hydrolase [Serratia liquefaciens]
MNHPVFPFRQIGDFQVTALSDGIISASLDLLSGIENVDARVIQYNAGISEPGDIHINCYLIRERGRTILVDTGTGSLSSTGGQLKANLEATGVSTDDVDTVLLTHCHPDHIGGLLDAEEKTVYKNAEVILHPLEAEHWWDDKKLKTANARGKSNFRLVRKTLNAYAQSVRFFNESKIAGNILPVWLPGHTPGHTGFRIDSGNKCLLIWGDIVHYPHIQSMQPNVSVVFDFDPAQAEETRKKVLEQAVSEKLLVAGMHLSRDAFANVLSTGDRYSISYAENE